MPAYSIIAAAFGCDQDWRPLTAPGAPELSHYEEAAGPPIAACYAHVRHIQ